MSKIEMAIASIREVEEVTGVNLTPVIDLIGQLRLEREDVDEDIQVKVSKILRELGTPPNLSGYKYIKAGLIKAYRNPDMLEAMMEFYSWVAENMKTSPTRVERAIRHSIDVTFNYTDPAIIEKYFGNAYSSTKGKPTNSEFLSGLFVWLQDTK